MNINTLVKTLSIATVLPVAAQAATMSNVQVISVQQDFFGPTTIETLTDSATDGEASVVVAPFTFSPNFTPLSATQRADGTSEVNAETTEQANTELNTAIASFIQEEVNTFGMDRDYTLDYSLSGMTARLNHSSDSGLFGQSGAPEFVNPFGDDFTTLIDSNFTAASFQYLITVNGDEVFSARADALVNEAGGTTENVSGFTTSLVDSFGFGNFVFGVGDISGTIDLGTFAAGETLNVVSTLIAQSYATGIQDELRNTVVSRSTDPVNLSSVGFLTSTATNPVTPSTVPLPAAGWLMIAGLGGLAATRRRKS